MLQGRDHFWYKPCMDELVLFCFRLCVCSARQLQFGLSPKHNLNLRCIYIFAHLSKALVESIEGFVHFTGHPCYFQIHFLFCVTESKI